jgi:uncharacterized coiled-coil DUF342 family protein
MFDEKLKRARQLIEKRDQIDEELRILFGEVPQAKRGRRRIERENGSGIALEKENGAAALEAHD